MYSEKDYNSTYWLCKRVIKDTIIPNYGKFLLAIVLMVLGALAVAYRAYLIKPAIDYIFVNKDQVQLMILPIQIIILALGLGAINYLQEYIIYVTYAKINMDLQEKIFKKLLNFDYDYFQSKSSGKILSHISSDTSGLISAMDLILNGLIRQFFTLIFLVGLMFSQSPILSVISLFGFPIVIYPIYKIGRKLRKLANKNQEEGAVFFSILNDSIQSIKLVKANNCEEHEINVVKNKLLSLFKIGKKMKRKSLISSPLMEMVGSIGFAGVILYGGMEVINGTSTPGEFFSFMTAMLSAYKPAKSFTGLNLKLQTAIACAKRLYITIDRETEIKEVKNPVIIKNINNSIKFKNVNFSYPYHSADEELVTLEKNTRLSDKPALVDLNLDIPVGKTIALVGHSGSGKSTIFNLLLRFYDPISGKIEIDGCDLKDMSIKSLRDKISIVSQDVRLFDTSILENIRYGTFDATEEDVKYAAQMANAEEFINELSGGYNTMVGQNGTLLSGGQKQRISIARALLKNAPILLLDEATSALDPISEKLIQKSLVHLMKNKTTLTIAHRLSTIMNADIIYVLEHGRLIETGTHHELLEKDGPYKLLYKKQFEEIK